MALDAGATLGRYRIERRLGAGAMGEVYLAQDPHIDRQLALKTVLIGDASEAEIEERKVRMIREARAAGRLVHPHVVTLFDAGESGGIFYLAFEFVAGPDLAGRQRLAPPLKLGEVLRIGRQAAEGLDAAHRQGIVHRDIKPSNILLDGGGQVKISDFGIAKMLGQATELTQTGSVVGSPHYLSPEQIRGEELDGRSDLFSLGVVLYELLTRHRPFEGETITTLVYQILAREPNPIAGLRPGLPDRVERTVVKMLCKDRDERFATAREVADELAACERELPAAVLASPAAAMPEELEETRQLAPPTPPPTPKPTPPAAWSMPMPGTPADATAPTRVSSRIGSGGAPGTPTPPLPPPPPPGDATGPTRLSPLVSGGAGAAPPPPMPPHTAATAAPAASLAAAPGVAARPPASGPARGFPWTIVIVVLALGLLTVVGGVAALLWLRGGGGKKADEAPAQVADQSASTVPASLPDAVRPAATEPVPAPAATVPAPPSTTAQ
ncbi:MAG TPA: serine/threonine-protein kinase, partial [Thermoanaerobaculia bacterium]|nr:serine/threonine-protein kinase [Thermoanaerobaculia bacterium]